MKNILVALFALMLFLGFAANAQKLPNIQENSIHAPVNIKIDGTATEWNDKFQAYNKAVSVFYSISNDDRNLYLTIQARDETIIEKIIKGGITFTINTVGVKNDKNGIAFTFPKITENFTIGLTNRPEKTDDTIKNKIRTENFVKTLNKQLNDKLKMIGVTGIKAFDDGLVPVYNTQGIKAAALFDDRLSYTYELLIPLKYLGINQSAKFSYNIKLNGTVANATNVRIISTSHGDRVIWTGADGIDYTEGISTSQSMISAYPTDFWGEYKLAK